MSEKMERKYFGYGLETLAIGSVSVGLVIAVFILMKENKKNRLEFENIKKDIKDLSEFSKGLDTNISQQLYEIQDILSKLKETKIQECEEGACFERQKQIKQQQIKPSKKQQKVVVQEEDEYESESSGSVI